MEVTPSWSMEANSGMRGRVRAAGKALEEDMADTHRHKSVYHKINCRIYYNFSISKNRCSNGS